MYSKDGEYIIKIEDNDVIEDKEVSSFDYKYLIIGSCVCLGLLFIYILKKKNSD